MPKVDQAIKPKSITNWSITASPFHAPELKAIRLVGTLECGIRTEC